MKLKLKVDDSQLRAKMREFEKATGREIGQQVKNFSRVAALELMRRTQPFGNSKVAKTSGEIAVARDTLRAFYRLTQSQLAKARALKAKGAKFAKMGTGSEAFWIDLSKDILTSQTELEDHHKSQRNRQGRVGKRASKEIAPVNVFNRFQKAKQKLVGFAKGGWATAAGKVGADTKSASTGRGIPAWVKRHVGMTSPKVTDKTKSGDPRVKFESGVDYMSSILPLSEQRAGLGIARHKFLQFIKRSLRAIYKKQGAA